MSSRKGCGPSCQTFARIYMFQPLTIIEEEDILYGSKIGTFSFYALFFVFFKIQTQEALNIQMKTCTEEEAMVA